MEAPSEIPPSRAKNKAPPSKKCVQCSEFIALACRTCPKCHAQQPKASKSQASSSVIVTYHTPASLNVIPVPARAIRNSGKESGSHHDQRHARSSSNIPTASQPRPDHPSQQRTAQTPSIAAVAEVTCIDQQSEADGMPASTCKFEPHQSFSMEEEDALDDRSAVHHLLQEGVALAEDVDAPFGIDDVSNVHTAVLLCYTNHLKHTKAAFTPVFVSSDHTYCMLVEDCKDGLPFTRLVRLVFIISH
jgi:hypothetical protein